MWNRKSGGGGRTNIIQDGAVIERGGVNFSAVHGQLPEKIAKKLRVPESYFYATGVSIVIHPHNPMMPIIHMNVRYFEVGNQKWFGGGIDLTPHYINLEDAQFFHHSLKAACDKFDESYYPEFKKWADDYFFIKHRNETRGIGGIFFDKLSEDKDHSLEERFEFVKAVGQAFAPMYSHLAKKNRDKPYSEKEKEWQLLRRGRYVEFNLVYDKGTKFGLDTDGRTESILMSLPKDVRWLYNHQPKKESPEEQTILMLKKGINWLKT